MHAPGVHEHVARILYIAYTQVFLHTYIPLTFYPRRGDTFTYCHLLRHPWKKETGANLLFCPGHHMRPRSLLCRISSFSTLIPLIGVSTTCFHHVMIKIQQMFFTVGRLPDVNPPWNWNGRQRINVFSEARRSSW
jgi:hypothetical protein